MSNGSYTLSSILLHSLLNKEQDVKLGGSVLSKFQNSNGDPPHNAAECVTSFERDREVRWICRMGRKLGLALNTVGLTVSILDRILCVVLVRPKYLNCVAVASMYLAVKLHEECFFDEHDENKEEEEADNNNTLFDAANLVTQLQVDYSVAELNRMERSLLRVLNWDLMLPSVDRFLQAMLVVIGAPHLIESLSLRENFEVVVSDWQLVSAFRPSVIALSLLSLMLQLTYVESWMRITESLKEIFKVDEIQFMKCRSQMSDVLKLHHKEKYQIAGKKSSNSPSSLKHLVSKYIEAQNKSRKRARQSFIDENGYCYSDEENGYGNPVNSCNIRSNNPAGKDKQNENEEDLRRDVLHVLYNIINAQQD